MATVKDLDSRLDDLERGFDELKAEVHEVRADLREFKAEVRTLVMLGKWLAGFCIATIASLLLAATSAIYSAGRLSAMVDLQSKETGRLSDKVDKLSQQMEEMRADLRQNRPAKP